MHDSSLIRILLYSPIDRPPDSFKYLDIYEDLKKIQFPSFDNEIISNIEFDVLNFTKYIDVFPKYNFFFPYLPRIISRLLKIEPTEETEMVYLTKFFILSYIPSKITIEGTCYCENYGVLLDSFIWVFKNSSFPPIKSIFFESIMHYLLNIKTVDFICLINKIHFAKMNGIPYNQSFEAILIRLLIRFVSDIPLNSEDCVECVLQFVEYAVECNEIELSPSSCISIIELLSVYILDLNIISLSIFIKVAPKASSDCIDSILNTLPIRITSFLLSNNLYSSLTPIKTNLILKENNNYGSSEMKISDLNCFKEKLNITPMSQVLTNNVPEKINHCIDTSFIQIISRAYTFSKKSLLILFDYFGNNTNSQDLIIFQSFLNELNSRIKLDGEQAFHFLKTSIKMRTFDNDVSSFDLNNYSSIIFRLRLDAIESLSNSGFPNLYGLLSLFLDSPIILSEVFQMISCFIDRIMINELLSNSFVRLFVSISQMFSKIHRLTSVESQYIVESTRESIFYFLSSCIDNPDVAQLWFSNPVFSPYYLTCLFEIPLNSYIIENLQKYLVKENGMFGANFISSIQSVIGVITNRLPEAISISIATNLFLCINNTLLHKKRIVHIFIDVSDVIISSLQKIDETDISHEYFIQVLQFISFSSEIKKLSKYQLEIIHSTCLKLKNMKYQPEIEMKLIQIMSGTQLLQKTSSIMIKESYFLQMIFELSKNDEHLTSSLNFIYEIIYKSFFNCTISYKGGLDSFLLSYLWDQSKLSNPKKWVFESILNILFYIHCHIISPSTARVYYHLMSSAVIQENNWIKETILKHVLRIISKSNNDIRKFIQLNSETSTMEIQGISPEMLQNGFTLCFWIHLENVTNKGQVCLFSMKTNKNRGFEIVISPPCLLLNIKAKRFTSTNKFRPSIPSGEWCQIAVTFQNLNGKLNYYSIINGERSLISNTNWKGFKNQTIHVQFLETKDMLNDGRPIGYFSQLALFNHSDHFNSYFFWNVRPHKAPSDAFVYFYLQENGKNLEFVSSNPKLLIRSNCTKSSFVYGLIDVLSYVFHIQSLLPLIFNSCNQIELPINQSIFEITIDLMIIMFQYSKQSQIDFLSFKCGDCIHYLLTQSHYHFYTYSMYTRFYSLLMNTSLRDVQNHIISNLMVNLDLLQQCTEENQIKIVRHWIRSLIPDIPDIFASSISFPQLLCSIEIFSKPVSSSLMSVLLTIAQFRFSDDDFIDVIGFCITCLDLDTIFGFLSILDNVIKFSHNITGISDSFHYFSLLHNLIGYNDPDIFYMLICILYHSYLESIITSNNIENHLFVLMNQVSPKIASITLITKLLSFVNNGLAELLPICCLLSCFIGNSGVLCLLQNIKVSPLLSKSNTNLLWISMLLLFTTEDQQIIIFDILFQRIIDNVLRVCIMIETLYGSRGIISTPIILSFLHKVISDFLLVPEEFGKDNAKKLIEISFFFLFYRSSQDYSIWISNIFDDPPFDHRYNKRNVSDSFLSVENQYWMIYNYAKGLKEYSFLPRIDENGFWIDFEFGSLVLNLFSLFPDLQLLNHIMLICSFMSSTSPSEVKKHILMINSNPNTIKTIESVYPYLAKQCQKSPCLSELLKESFSLFESFIALHYFIGSHNFASSVYIALNEICIDWESKVNTEKRFMYLTNDSLDSRYLDRKAHISTITLTSREYKKEIWNELYEKLSSQKSLWSVPEYTKIPSGMKRESIYCSFGCPFIVKTYIKNKSSNNVSSGIIKSLSLSSIDGFDSIHKYDVELVTINGCIKYLFEITLKFFRLTSIIKKKEERLSVIRHIAPRNRYHLPTAIEIFMKSGKSYFVDFIDTDNKIIIGHFSKLITNDEQIQPNIGSQSLLKTIKWTKRKISTFEYLMNINFCSGRSFHDTSQYPVFPWVLTNYDTELIDLNDCQSFRDFRKPIGAINMQKIKELRERAWNASKMGMVQYLYSNGPIHPATIQSFLSRIYSFDEKDGSPRKSFFSINKFFEIIKKDPSENSELIPEFFYQPEIFVAHDQSLCSENVELPPWASNPFEFVYLNRKALESEYSSSNIHHWIDLIWGYKQNPPFSHEHDNQYSPFLYHNVWRQYNNYGIEPNQIKIMLAHMGQIPPCLFNDPHLPREKININNDESVVLSLNDSDIYGTVVYSGSIHIEGLVFSKTGSVIQIISENRLISHNKLGVFIISPKIHGFYPNHGFVYSSYNNRTLTYISLDGTQIITNEVTDDIIYISAASQHIIAITRDWNLFIWNIQNFGKPYYSQKFVFGPPLCSTVSSSFDAIAIGSVHSVSILSLYKGVEIRAIDLCSVSPKEVIISSAWGFITVYSEEWGDDSQDPGFLIYSINGERLRTCRIRERVMLLITFTSSSGFDYIAYLTEHNKLYLGEIFYLSFNEPIYRPKHLICSIEYIREAESISLTSKNGRIILLPVSKYL